MKFLFLLSAAWLISTSAHSQFSVGAVQYSILDTTAFYRLNPGWVLMDGRTITGSRLASQANITKIPDARGMFIRAMQGKRNNDNGDTQANRVVGTTQADAVGKHTHEINMRTGYMLNLGDYQNPPPLSIFIGDRPAYNNSYGTLTAKDDQLSIETRPRNIALYVYIKID